MRDLLGNCDRAHQLTDVISPSRASDRASYRYDKAGNPIRRTEMGFGIINSFNNLNQIVSGIWTGGAITVAGAVNYAAGTVTVNSVTGRIFPDRVFEVTNVTITAGTNILTAVYHGPGFTNTQMVATDKVTVIVGNAAYTHDGNGNLTGDQNFTYQYDLANRLTNVILKASNVSVLAISYDGLGRRIQVVRNGATVERYVYLPGSFLVLAILDGSNQLKEIYTHGPDLSGTIGGAGGIGGILSCRIGTTNVWLHPDAMGNVILASDQQGKEVGQYRYSPFGRSLNQTGAFTPRFQFSSKEFDPESGLLNFGFRYLDPATGRWLGRDPLKEYYGLNLYEFVRNAPLNWIDPDGLAPYGANNPVTGPWGPVGPSSPDPFSPNPYDSLRGATWRVLWVAEIFGAYRELYAEEAGQLNALRGVVSEGELAAMRGQLKAKYQRLTPPEVEEALRAVVGGKRYETRAPSGSFNPGKTDATINAAGAGLKYVGRVLLVIMVVDEARRVAKSDDWAKQLGESGSGFLGSVVGGAAGARIAQIGAQALAVNPYARVAITVGGGLIGGATGYELSTKTFDHLYDIYICDPGSEPQSR